MITKNIFQHMFGKYHIVGFAGSKNEGKTNNLIAAMIDFRKTNKETKIYYYGFDKEVSEWISLNISDAEELSSLAQYNSKDKKKSLFIIDEFQRLQLNDRRYRDLVSDFVNLVYHQNNWLILSSPDLKEFNTIIGSKIERWVLKSLRTDELVRGSQLKMAALSYKGAGGFGGLGLQVGKNEAIIINEDKELVLRFDYIEEADNKRELNNIFGNVGGNVNSTGFYRSELRREEMSGECQENVGGNVGGNVRTELSISEIKPQLEETWKTY